MSFRYKDESIHNLLFAIDNHSVSLGTNNDEWNQFEYFINAGEHTLSWIISEYSDNIYAYIDYITFRPNYDNVDEININDNIKIHPNPTKEFINIEIKDESIEAYRIKIYNSAGINVIDQDFNNIIDVSDLTSGVYLINIYSDKKIFSRSFIIQ